MEIVFSPRIKNQVVTLLLVAYSVPLKHINARTYFNGITDMLDSPLAHMVLALLTFVTSVLSNGAFAQTGKLEEVIVTATKRAKSLQDIPVTVQALTESAIHRSWR